MACLSASILVPSKLKPSFGYEDHLCRSFKPSSYSKKNNYFSPVMRLFGPAIFEASKLKVLILGVDKENKPKLPRTYTLTHSDITSKLTLAISQTINNSQLQGWYNKLQRDEVVGEWRKVKGKMSLHVHCHISGGHFLLDLFAKLRYYIFYKELPVVLKAFVQGDENLFNNYPELEDAVVWVYFHSNFEEFNKVECWGPLKDAAAPGSRMKNNIGVTIDGATQEHAYIEEASLASESHKLGMPETCKESCTCCFPPTSIIPWSQSPSQEELHSQASLSVSGTRKGVNQ